MKQKLVVIASVVLLILLSAAVFYKSKKPVESMLCGAVSCENGCCVKGKCIPKGLEIAGYTCRENNTWQTPEGKIETKLPEAVSIAVGQALEVPGLLSSEKAREIAQNIVSWLDGMKNDKGQYFANENCASDGLCQTSSTIDKQRGIITVWSRYRNYLGSRNAPEMDLIDAELATLTTPGVGSPAQNDYLNCTLMYELHKSNVFTPQQKNKITSICNDSIFYGEEMNNYNQRSKSDEAYSAEPAVELFLEGKPVNTGLNANPDKMIKYSSYTADMATLYIWTKEAKALELGKYFFNLALETKSQELENTDDSLLGLAAYKFYEATGEQKYLEASGKFMEEKSTGLKCSNFVYCVNYLYFLDYYSDKTDDPEIKLKSEELFAMLMANFYDSGKNLFYYKNENGINYYPVAQNSILSGILANY